ncbi:ubiquitin-protein ligase E3B-like [Sycon ciliatum]|uniref:ubiquitin-protein ligase E3B-like n=1 Tax=Sycon ciliatum TaxID=27933 RepID=UPI0031F5F68A
MFASAHSKKDDLLQDAHAAREARRLQVVKTDAAIKLQAFWRRCSVFIRLRREHRLKCDEIFPGDRDHVQTLSALDQFWCIRRWLFTYHSVQDAERLSNICQGLISSMAQSTPKVWYVSMIGHNKLIPAWIVQVKTLCTMAMKCLGTLKPWTGRDSSLMILYLRMLITFTECTGWQLTAKAGDAVKTTLKQLCRSIQKHVVEAGLYASLKDLGMNGLCRDPVALSSSALLSIVTLSLRPLSSSGYSTARLMDVSIYLLSLPALVSHLRQSGAQHIALLERPQLLKRVLTILADPSNMKTVFESLHAIKSICLLGNLIELYTVTPKPQATEIRTPFVDVIGCTFELCQRYVGVRKGSSSSSFHQLLGWFQQKAADERLAEGTPLVNRQIEKLWLESTITQLFGDVISASSVEDAGAQKGAASDAASGTKKPKGIWGRLFDFRITHLSTSALKLDSPEFCSLRKICSLYHGCLKTFVQIKIEILTSLCFHPGLLPSMWQYLNSKSTLEHITKMSHDEAAISQHPLGSVLALFCNCCTHVLAIVDDIEMYEEQRPFTLPQLILLSGFLNKLCFNLIWHAGSAAKAVPATGVSSSRATASSAATVSAAAAKAGIEQVLSDSSFTLLSAAHSLLMLLHDRDCRRNYAPADHWIIDSVPLSSFRQELERRKQRATTLLRMMPHTIPYLERAKIFRDLVHKDKLQLGLAGQDLDVYGASTYITVRRNALLEDGFAQLSKLRIQDAKGIIRIKFVNEQGLDEAGIDQDGVFKEFLEEIVKQVFNPNFALFKSVEEGSNVYPSPNSYLHNDHLQLFEFVGRLLGKAVYEGIVIEVPFASFFLTQILGRTHSFAYSSFDELSSMDAELYRRLSELKRYEGNVEDDFCLTFAIDEDRLGKLVTHDLKPCGRVIPVTDTNRISYIHLMANFKLCTQIYKQSSAFCRGFHSFVQPDWLVFFSSPELQRLISGDNQPLDVGDLRKYVEYSGGFSSAHSVIRWLWDVVEKELDQEEKGLFLKFVTSCSKPPVLGFAHLQPPFHIRLVEVGDDQDTGDSVVSVMRGLLGIGARARQSRDRLPTASTCFNMLKLPNYSKKTVLRDKLRYAIRANAGFELS